MEKIPITIIGGGVVGSAIAYELSRKTGKRIAVLERHPENRQENQSSRNSGVIHAGIYYQQEKAPLKARLCVEGNRLVYDFCAEHWIPHKAVGKLVVATNLREEEYLEETVRISTENKVPGFRVIDGIEAKIMEPNITCTKAIYFPTSGIVEAPSFVKKLKQLSANVGVHYAYGTKVVGIKPIKDGKSFEIMTETMGHKNHTIEPVETELLFNCTGLYSDEIARMINPESQWDIFPTRGEAAKFYNTRREELKAGRMNVYPAPYGFFNDTGKKAEIDFSEFKKLLQEGKITKTVGVHLTPTIGNDRGEFFDAEGNVIIGKTVTVGPADSINFGKENYRHHHPLEHYVREVSRFFPQLRPEDLEFHQVGIQAKTKTHYDWIIERDRKYHNCIQLVGIDSPGLTGSLAIARYVVGEMLGLNE